MVVQEVSKKSAINTKSPRMSETWNNSDVETVILEGGWQGFHCETTIINALFSVLMFDIIFLTKPFDNEAPENSESELFDLKDMFITPLQDHPLDMLIPSNKTSLDNSSSYENIGFYNRRHKAIEARLALLSRLNSNFISTEADVLIDEATSTLESYEEYMETLEGITDPEDYKLSLSRFFSFSYRHNYKSQCIGLSWSYPMAALQLIAISMGE